MKTSCVRQGQIEVGFIEHQGGEFSALGATVVGRHVTGYTRQVKGDIQLSTWCSATMLATRCEVVERFWSGSMALMFRLTNDRYIVGYALGECGMLFRGELLTNCDEDDVFVSRDDQSVVFDLLDRRRETWECVLTWRSGRKFVGRC